MKRLFIGVTAALAAVMPFAASASAQEAPAQIRVAHFSPDTPGVDVYVDGAQAVGNMGFETVTDYLAVPPGDHLLELRPSGAAPDSEPVWSGTAPLESGVFYTAAGLGERADLEAKVFVDSVATPPAGQATARFIHAAVGAPTVDVTFGSDALQFTDAAFAVATEYQPVAPGNYPVALSDPAGDNLVESQAVEFTSGINYTVVAIGGDGTPVRILPVVDARSASETPAVGGGGIGTGGGGTAERPQSNKLVPGIVVAVLLSAIVAGVIVSHRPRVEET